MNLRFLHLCPAFLLVMIANTLFAQWAPTSGSEGGSITCIAACGDSDIFAGTIRSGVFLSTNGGESWTGIGPAQTPVNSVAATDSIIFLATNGDGILKSADRGVNWGHADSGITYENITPGVFTSIALIGTDLFASTVGGVWMSPDYGRSWSQLSAKTYYGFFEGALSFAVSGNIIFAGTDGDDIFRSLDGGKTWSELVSSRNIGARQYSIAIKEPFNGTDTTRIFVGTNSGVYVSVDTGNTWIVANNGLTNTDVRTLAINGDTILAGTNGSGVFRSTDDGASWSAVCGILSDASMTSLQLVPAGGESTAGTWLAGSTGGVYLSTDRGLSWNPSERGLVSLSINDLILDFGNLYAATEGAGVFVSTDDGASWSAINNGMTSLNVYSLIFKDGVLFAGTDGDGVFRSTDLGLSWSPANTGLISIYSGFNNIRAFAALDTDILVGTWGAGVFLSTNDGTTWMGPYFGTFPIPHGSGGSSFVCSLAPFTGGVYCGSSDGIFVSTDGGITWEPELEVWARSGEGNASFLSFSQYAQGVYAGVSGTLDEDGVIYQSAGDSTWVKMNNGLTDSSVQCLASSGTSLLAGTAQNGVFITSNGGEQWHPANLGLPTGNIHSLVIDGTTVYAGTYYGSVWRGDLSNIVAIRKKNDATLSNYFLFQNYPNPFNPSTEISYQLPSSSYVFLKVFDVLGREVKVLVNKQETAGSYSVNFDASNLPSGVYFYRLEAGTYSNTKKLLLLK